MPDENTKAARWIRLVRILAICITTVLLLTTLVFIFLESTWVEERPSPSPEEAFLYGLAGTEVLPLPVFKVLPSLFPDQFQPAGLEAGDWVEQFGFIPGKPDVNEGLPQGFSVSNYRPRSGSPSPVKFVGFNCSLCHTSMIKRSEEDEGVMVHGMGSTSLDFIAWVDALRTALMDEERLTMETIEDAYEKEFDGSLGLMEGLMIRLWLTGIRSAMTESVGRYDEPYHGEELRDAKLMINGPARTQPFRNLVRSVLNRPAATDRAMCKFPVLYQQGLREWGQYDGSVGDRLTRSVLAAIATGATIDNLVLPDVSESVQQAIKYSETLHGPKYLEIFPGQTLDAEKVERGRPVYKQYCDNCHGSPGPDGNWVKGSREGEVVPVEEIQTDAERVTFRYYDIITDHLYDLFPDEHPLKPKRENLRPGPRGTTKGYLNMPMDSAFARAPYLHNGSVLTMAELINLKPRREVFYRGDNVYDPIDLGLIAPDQPDVRHYYEMDTRRDGNSRKGHDYPWPYQGPGWDKAALEDLLEYMKTL